MASSWIAKKAEEHKKQEEETRREREWRQYEATIIEAKWPEVKDRLEAVVRETIAEWNETFPQDDKKIDGVFRNVVRGFRIDKTRFPGGTVTVVFDSISRIIQCDVIKPTMVGAGDYTRTLKFRMCVAKDDSIYLTDHSSAHVSPNDISRILIESITEIG
jgi:hypothetical protein